MSEERTDVCRDCGAELVNIPGTPHAVCPNGHGRLVRRFSRDERKALRLARKWGPLPQAKRIRPHGKRWVIDGQEGEWILARDDNRLAVPQDAHLDVGELLAKLHIVRRRFHIDARGRKYETHHAYYVCRWFERYERHNQKGERHDPA
jgi:hypothetical protein